MTRTRLVTFGVNADSVGAARPRLERMEAEVVGSLRKLGVRARPLSGRERLGILHGLLHPGEYEPFRFAWEVIPQTGLSTKDYIAPTSFDFRQSRRSVSARRGARLRICKFWRRNFPTGCWPNYWNWTRR